MPGRRQGRTVAGRRLGVWSVAAARTVSVLFTDLVGSTELLARVGDEAADELRRSHFAALSELVARYGGEQVKSQGDGLMAVFDSATGAVGCAGEMQQVVERDNRRHGRQQSIRVGISVGEATAEDGDYFGTPVVEAARLCAAAAGGQILANDLLRLLIGSRSRQTLIPSGSRLLKGLPEPVAVCEVVWHRTVDPQSDIGQFSHVDLAAEPDMLVEILDQQRARPFFRSLRQKTYERLDVRPGDHVLDVGCGTGDDAQELAALVAPDGVVVGVDLSTVMINESEARAQRSGASNVEFRLDDATALTFDDGRFDGCRADRVLQHIVDQARALREMVRVTRPGRRVVVCDTDWGTRSIAHPDRALTRRLLDHWCDRYGTGWTGRELKGLFVDAGLDAITATAEIALTTEWDGYAQWTCYGLARYALATEEIDADDAARWVAQLDELAAAGKFVSSLTIFTVTGTVPSPR